ncbi:unnamed protein product [Ectocarpus sp. 8 AP-2014]
MNEGLCAPRNREFEPLFSSLMQSNQSSAQTNALFQGDTFSTQPGQAVVFTESTHAIHVPPVYEINIDRHQNGYLLFIRQPNASFLGSAGGKVDTIVSRHHTTPSKKALLPIDRIQRLTHEKGALFR